MDAGVSFIGGAEGASGTVTVIGTDRAGAPTTWRSYGGLLVGADLGEGFGEGRIDVLSGGYALAGVDFNSPVLPTVTFGPKGQVNVSGSIEDVEGVLKPSTFWAGGVLQMSGDMTVSDGGLFVTQGLSELGNTPDDPSVATIRGSDSAGNASTWAALGGMLIGRFGTAELHIEDGAHVMTGSGAIGSFHSDADWDAVVNVTGSNGNGVPSRWEMSGILYAGGTPFGSTGVTGTLNITDGGRVSSSEGWIGVGGTAPGTVSVRGHDGHGLTSTWDVGGRLRVGVESTGQLAILDGGIVNSASGYVGELNGSSGLVTVSGAGSTWTVTNHLVLGGSGLSNSTTGNGVLTVRDGGLVDVGGTLKIFPGSTLNGNGTVRGYIENAGLIAPGNSAGTLTLEGNVLSYPSSMLSIELGGTGAGQFDVLNVLGSFHAYGELSVSLIDGFHPNGTESFTILTAYALTGYFTNAVPAFGDIAASVTFGDLTFDVVYDYANGRVILTNVVPEPATLGLMVAGLGLIRRRNRRVAV